MDDEISQGGSLKEESLSTKPSQIANQSAVDVITEEDGEVGEGDIERTTTSISESNQDVFDAEDEEEDVEEEIFLNDPGLAEAYALGTAKPPLGEADEALYLRLVKEAKIMPIKRIWNSLKGSRVHLQYYGMDSAQMKPLCESLFENTSVKELNLKSNLLSLDAMYHLGLMLRKNVHLSVLNLSQCKITAEGIDLLGTGLEICPRLAVLDLSYNDFGDEGMVILANKLCYNFSITDLNLSHNNLTYKTGIYLAETMEENYSLQKLDLSWNQISEDQGLKKFLYSAAEHNENLHTLDLSWNTLSGDKTANIIKTFIGQHRSLEELNLSHNRFETSSEVTKIAKGINIAPSLKTINLSYNGITADTAFVLLSSINNKAKLNTLRLDNVWVKPEFEKLRRDLESQIGLKVITEGVTGGFGLKGPDMQTLLLRRAHHLGNLPKKPKNRKDFGWFLLRLQKKDNLVPVKKAKFEKLVTEDKIKFDEGMVDELAKRFRDENKKIDLNMMLEKYMSLYPETALPIPKEKKKKEAKGKKKSGTGDEEKKDELVSPEGHVDTENPEEKEEIKSPEKHDETKGEVREDTEKLTDIPELESEENKRESVQSQKKISIVDGPENENIKEVNAEADKEIVPEEGNIIEQTEGKTTTEKTDLEENLEVTKEHSEKESNTELNVVNNEEQEKNDTV